MDKTLERKLKELGYISYHQYRKAKHWAAFSKQVRKEVGHCQFCGVKEKDLVSPGYLVVHHKLNRYENLGKETVVDITVFCNKCHDEIHDSMTATRSSYDYKSELAEYAKQIKRQKYITKLEREAMLKISEHIAKFQLVEKVIEIVKFIDVFYIKEEGRPIESLVPSEIILEMKDLFETDELPINTDVLIPSLMCGIEILKEREGVKE